MTIKSHSSIQEVGVCIVKRERRNRREEEKKEERKREERKRKERGKRFKGKLEESSAKQENLRKGEDGNEMEMKLKERQSFCLQK